MDKFQKHRHVSDLVAPPFKKNTTHSVLVSPPCFPPGLLRRSCGTPPPHHPPGPSPALLWPVRAQVHYASCSAIAYLCVRQDVRAALCEATVGILMEALDLFVARCPVLCMCRARALPSAPVLQPPGKQLQSDRFEAATRARFFEQARGNRPRGVAICDLRRRYRNGKVRGWPCAPVSACVALPARGIC